MPLAGTDASCITCPRSTVLAAGQAAAPFLTGECGERVVLPVAGRGPSNTGMSQRPRMRTPCAAVCRRAPASLALPLLQRRAPLGPLVGRSPGLTRPCVRLRSHPEQRLLTPPVAAPPSSSVHVVTRSSFKKKEKHVAMMFFRSRVCDTSLHSRRVRAPQPRTQGRPRPQPAPASVPVPSALLSRVLRLPGPGLCPPSAWTMLPPGSRPRPLPFLLVSPVPCQGLSQHSLWCQR